MKFWLDGFWSFAVKEFWVLQIIFLNVKTVVMVMLIRNFNLYGIITVTVYVIFYIFPLFF